MYYNSMDLKLVKLTLQGCTIDSESVFVLAACLTQGWLYPMSHSGSQRGLQVSPGSCDIRSINSSTNSTHGCMPAGAAGVLLRRCVTRQAGGAVQGMKAA
jgi:hypothetical protein